MRRLLKDLPPGEYVDLADGLSRRSTGTSGRLRMEGRRAKNRTASTTRLHMQRWYL